MKIIYYAKKAVNKYSPYMWTMINKISFAMNGIRYGKNLSVRGKVYTIFHSDKASITIGDNVTINASRISNPIGTGDGTYFQMVGEGKIIIGNNCGISNSAFTCANSIILEDNVLLGSGCKIYDTDFHALQYSERIKGNYRGAPIRTKEIIIKEGAFVGAGSYILKGVTVGRHSIIGAGSVLTKNVPDNEIWAGNPARFIRKVEDE